MDLTPNTEKEAPTPVGSAQGRKKQSLKKKNRSSHRRAVQGLKQSARRQGIPLRQFMKNSSHPAAKVWLKNKGLVE
jgi:hypothetical protein